MRPAGRRAGSPGGVRGAECSPICRAHSGLVPFLPIYLCKKFIELFTYLRETFVTLASCTLAMHRAPVVSGLSP